MKKVITIILDGFGIRNDEHGNAIKAADMKNFDEMWKAYPHTLLEASGEKVGLAEGQFGNSEVGHTAIGAGRLVKQNDIIVREFLDKSYEDNASFIEMLEDKEKHFHIMGLASDGNVHSDIQNFLLMYEILYKNDIKNIHFHLITDGRDTKIDSSIQYIEKIDNIISSTGVGDISTICGRYYAMDRDKNYDRTKHYYDLISKGIGIRAVDYKKAILSQYDKGTTDEFIKPIILNNNTIKDGDNIIWMNFRADRAKQIIGVLSDPKFDVFYRQPLTNSKIYTMLPVDEEYEAISFSKPDEIFNPLGIYLSKLDINQVRIAESEKFPHVTYFFDGGYDGKISKCNKYEVPSQKVKTYDVVPQMSALEITKLACKSMESDIDFILVNFANPDMVGHTGNYDATINACTTVDMCLGKICEIADDNFYKVIVLSDHGNADMMLYEDGGICTTHTSSKVPFIIRDNSVDLKPSGDLTMVAPTILEYMDIKVPTEMENTPILLVG